MLELSTKMNLLVSTFAEMFPARTVDRSYVDISSLEDDAAQAGCFSFMFKEKDDFQNDIYGKGRNGTDKIMIIGRRFMGEDANGETIEDEEFKMCGELNFMLNSSNFPHALQNISLISVRTSSQLEKPWAWIVAEIQITE